MSNARRYFLKINAYRTSTAPGPVGGWAVREVTSRKAQINLLTNGLPVDDRHLLDDHDRRSDCYSTLGIAPLTAGERRQALRDERDGLPVQLHR